MATYATAAELKADPGVPDGMSDADAERLVEQAEDRIDDVIGPWPVDPETGRKIAESDVQPWQWEKLGRATVAAASRAYQHPELAEPQTHAHVKGPDFEVRGPLAQDASSMLGDEVMVLLRAARLAVTSAPVG